VQYALRTGPLLSFLESEPQLAGKLTPPRAKEPDFEDVMKAAGQAAALVLVYGALVDSSHQFHPTRVKPVQDNPAA